MSQAQPLTWNQRMAVQGFMLVMLLAVALVVYGVFYPILNDGLRASAGLAMGVTAAGGAFSIWLYNQNS